MPRGELSDGDVVAFYFPAGIAYDYADMVQDDGEDAIPPAPVERFHWRVDDGAIYLTPVGTTDPLATATMARHEWRPVAGEAGA